MNETEVRPCSVCNKEFNSRWLYCSNECVIEAHRRARKEKEIEKMKNENMQLAYQNEQLRLNVICTKEMYPGNSYPRIVDEKGKMLN
jgi:predicted nucleic acid-binding Zn ribbon protein